MRPQMMTLTIPLAGGVDTKSDPRVVRLPYLAAVENAVFTEPGGLQKRRGGAAVSTSISPTGSLANIRKLATRGDELLCFTNTTLYSYSDKLDKWVSRGEHLATKVTSSRVCAKTTNQTVGERAELNGVVFYAWEDSSDGGVHVEAVDAETGAVLVADTSMGAAYTRPRMVALTDKVLLFAVDSAGTDFVGKALDPDSLSSSIGAAFTVLDGSFPSPFYYDACKMTATLAVVAYQRAGFASYYVLKVAENLGLTVQIVARNAIDGVAVCAKSDMIGILRHAATNDMRADLLNTDLTDTANVDIQVSSLASHCTAHVACEFETNSSPDLMYCFWGLHNAPGTTVTPPGTYTWTRYNYVNTSTGALKSANGEYFAYDMSLGSRPFVHGGNVYLFLTHAEELNPPTATMFGSQLQNTYYLYRHDQTLHGKALTYTCGGYVSTSRFSFLPTVVNTATNTWKFCGTARTRVKAGNNSQQYTGSVLADITLEFDSNDARRTVEVDGTLYISGSMLMMYDGGSLVEVGFNGLPWHYDGNESHAATENLEANVTYDYKYLYEWFNRNGQREQGTSVTSSQVTDPNHYRIGYIPSYLRPTRKTGSVCEVGVVFYRTEDNPTTDSLHYRSSSMNPAATGENGYMTNDPDAPYGQWYDNLASADLIAQEILYTDTTELDNIAPAGCGLISYGQKRIFINDSADEHRAWYSKLSRGDQIVGFNDGLFLDTPQMQSGGVLTAIYPLDDAVVFFKEDRIYVSTGLGPDNTGVNGNYDEPRLVSSDVGCTDCRTVVDTPSGIIFMSRKGWHLLDRGYSVRYIGAEVEDYNSQTFVSAILMQDRKEVRLLASSGYSLLYDYQAGTWATSSRVGIDAVLYGANYYYAPSATALMVEDSSFRENTTNYSLAATTPWVRPQDNVDGVQVCHHISVLGEHRSGHTLLCKVAYDDNDTWIDSVSHTPETAAYASGNITTPAKSEFVDGETLTIHDGTSEYVFEFDVAGDGVSGSNVQVNISADTTAAQVAARLISAINGTAIKITAASGSGAVVTLTHDVATYAGNVSIGATVASSGFVYNGMSGGVTAPVAGDPLEFRFRPSRARFRSIKIRLEVNALSGTVLEGAKLTAIGLECAVQPAIAYKLQASKTG